MDKLIEAELCVELRYLFKNHPHLKVALMDRLSAIQPVYKHIPHTHTHTHTARSVPL